MLIKFIKFCIVGGTGALITFGITWLLTEQFNLWYMASLVIATGIAMTSNFLLNSYWTFGVKKRTPEDDDYEWHSFYNGNPIQKWWKQSIAKTIWEWMPNESKILNIGCGSSPIASNYNHITNIDVDSKKLDFMRNKLPELKFEEGNAQSLKYQNQTFDHVLCIEVIEHLPKPELVIKEIARVLKTGGNAIIATPDYSKTLWHLAELFTPYKEQHGSQLTKTAIESMCRSFGLQPTRYKYIAGCDFIGEFKKVF